MDFSVNMSIQQDSMTQAMREAAMIMKLRTQEEAVQQVWRTLDSKRERRGEASARRKTMEL